MAKLGSGTLSANGNTGSFETKTGKIFVQATGNFGGGSLEAEVSFDGTIYTTPEDGTINAENAFMLTVPVNTAVRLNLSGATTPSIQWVISDY